MRHPAPTRAAHVQFCHTEGWTQVRDATGRTGTHHLTYRLDLPDGTTLRTRISHPPDRCTYGALMWSHILRDQLKVTEKGFWACVTDGQRPVRGTPAPRTAEVPLELVNLLVVKFRVPEREVAVMSRQEALDRLRELWTQPTSELVSPAVDRP